MSMQAHIHSASAARGKLQATRLNTPRTDQGKHFLSS
jgi:hypothetical protein